MSGNRASMVGLEDNSDDEDEYLPEADEDPIPKRRRGVNKIYCLQEVFDSLELAKQAIEQEEIWTFKNKKPSKAGVKHFYRCNKCLARGKQCSAVCLIFLPADNLTAEVHRTMCAHDHDVRVLSVSLECREEIRKMHQITKTTTPANIILL